MRKRVIKTVILVLLALLLVDFALGEVVNSLWESELGKSGANDAGSGANNIEDIFINPQVLKNMTPEQVKALVPDKGWSIGTLGKGSQQGSGLMIRELNPLGKPTGRIIQWHPGGGHHGVEPYFKLSSGTTGTVRIGPQFPE